VRTARLAATAPAALRPRAQGLRATPVWPLAALLVALACAPPPGSPAPATRAGAADDRAEEREPPLLQWVTRPLPGDWPQIEARGLLRVLVVEDRTRFFVAEGRARGFEYELVHELERHLEARAARSGGAPVEVAFVPMPFERLLPALVEGHGDVVAAGLTVTAERRRLVDFSEPYLRDVSQIVVSHAAAPPVRSLDDLSGRTLCVVAGTSYAAGLERLDRDLRRRGLAPIERVEAGRGLTTEDVLELVHAGAFQHTVSDRHVAELWSQVLDDLRLEGDVRLEEGGELAWAIRKDSPGLAQLLDGFLRERRQGTLVGNVLFKRYFESTRWVRNPLVELDQGRLAPFLEPLQRLSAEHGFDWRWIAAQAYQESRLDPAARSPAGAVGLMQLMPSTAAELGVTDPGDPEQSLDAGTRYMARLRDRYFDEPSLPEPVRHDFTLAAYNAGPARVRRWRERAAGRGLDPDRWFGHVEKVALHEVGLEPVRYVANVNKVYLVLARGLELRAARRRELEALEAGRAR
jgi:membrane-bound lytic murein transglycosylase MltF